MKEHRYIRVSINSKEHPSHVVVKFKHVFSFKPWRDRDTTEWHDVVDGSVVFSVEEWGALSLHLRRSGIFSHIDESKTVLSALSSLRAVP